ncbi:erythromycin esterase family protein [Spirillospora sp. NPDC048911]|uniref:erythromycin esterase family protein n=1 Tax=Spirillospora sp. NPDC048911 TaxID=3364527 RepID=UPI0037242380
MPIKTRRDVLQGLLATGALVAVPRAAEADDRATVVGTLGAHAHPLLSTEPAGGMKDLAALGKMVDGAAMVGLGEATHNSREFFTMKHRVFRYLVRTKGFTAFSQEVHVAAGLRVNDYVVNGTGDIRQIMDEEFQGGTRLWNTREYLDLFQWMRAYNARHATKLHYVGNDIDYPGAELFTRIEDYVRSHMPELFQAVRQRYRNLRPADGMDRWTQDYPKKSLAERKATLADTTQVVELLRERGAAATVVQYATFIAQVAEIYSYDLNDQDELLRAVQHREQAMADNTIWWNRRTGGRTLLSAHNGHVAYGNSSPEYRYRVQGDLIRQQIGQNYVNIGFTFDRGSFNAFDPDTGLLRPVTVGPAEKDSNEHTLDKVRYRDYMLDMRTVPEPARTWLRQTRLTREIGSDYPDPARPVALADFYDVLIHLHHINPATLL